MKRPLVAAAALVVLVNAFALAGVAWNRRGEPEAVVELTAREFYFSWSSSEERENSGLTLSLSWNEGWHHPGLGWLDAARLRDLGFDTSVPPDSEGASEFYRRQPARRAFVALEMDGPEWPRWLASKEKELDEMAAQVSRGEATSEDRERMARSHESDRVEHSRLFAVDAALDPAQLRLRHPDRTRVFILPARVAIEHWNIKEEGELHGTIQALLIPRINVPLRHRPLLDGAIEQERATRSADATVTQPAPPRPPRWAMTLAFGRRLEPWIVSVRALPD